MPEETYERFTDYFLRYTADVPADGVEAHQKFSRDCPCQPEVVFDDLNGWHSIKHHARK